jgi:cell cycle arrest protein BUB3
VLDPDYSLAFILLRSAPTPLKESLTLPTKIYSLAYAPTTRTLIVSMANRKVFVYNLDINELKSNLSSGQGGLGKPQQERESALKFMTRSVAVMADGQGESYSPLSEPSSVISPAGSGRRNRV